MKDSGTLQGQNSKTRKQFLIIMAKIDKTNTVKMLIKQNTFYASHKSFINVARKAKRKICCASQALFRFKLKGSKTMNPDGQSILVSLTNHQ